MATHCAPLMSPIRLLFVVLLCGAISLKKARGQDAVVVPIGDRVHCVAFSPNGRTIACGAGSDVVLCDTVTRKVRAVLKGSNAGVNSIAFSPDGKTFVAGGGHTGSYDVRLWSMVSGSEKAILDLPLPVYSVAVSPDGKLVAAASADRTETQVHFGIARVWDVSGKKPKEIATLKGQGRAIRSVLFVQTEEELQLRKALEKKEKSGLTQERKPSKSAPLQSPAYRLLTGGDDGSIKVWDMSTLKEVNVLKGHKKAVVSLALSQKGRWLASGSEDKLAMVWDIDMQEEPLALDGHKDIVTCVAVSPDGKVVATSSIDQTIRLWSCPSGKSLATLRGHTGYVHAVAFSPDSKTLASGGDEKTIRLWNVQKGIEANKDN